MSDDLSINQQQYSNNAIPGLLTGAAIGGAGGAYAASQGYGIGRKVSAEKILNQKPDVFVRMIDNGGKNREAWQIARDFAQELSEKGKEYDEKLSIIKEKLIPALEEYRKAILPEIEKLQKNSSSYTRAIEQLEAAKKSNDTKLIAKLTDVINKHNDNFVKKAKEIIKDTDARKNYLKVAKESVESGIPNVKRGTKLATEAQDWINSIGSRDEYLQKLKDKAIAEIEPHLDKLKLPSKTLTGIVAGAVLAIAGLAIGMAIKNKDENV